jgi:hypothetical protein
MTKITSRATQLPLIALLLVSSASPALAAQVQVLSNPVPNGGIVMDGKLDDWLTVTPYQLDTVGDGSSGPGRPLDIDILQGAVAHDDHYFYFLYRATGDNMIDPASNWIFMDMDQNASTGLTAAGHPFSIGAEYNLGGTTGFNKWNANGTFGGGSSNTRIVVTGDSDNSGGHDFLEYAVARQAPQPGGGFFEPTGNQFNLIFMVEDTVTDYSPNNGNVDWFTYRVGPVPEPSSLMLSCLGGGFGLRRLRRRK